MNSLQDPFKHKKMQRNDNSFLKILLVIIVLIGIGVGGYFLLGKLGVIKTQSVLGTQDQSQSDTDKYNALITKIKKIILVPDENPTIATIANLDEVKKQNPTFYADAQQGDTVIIFSTKALIYREKEDKIINVAPVTKEDSSTNTGN